MTDTPHTTDRPPASEARAELHRQWLEHAEALFERFFPAEAAPTPAFDQLEQRAGNLANDLASWLLERRVNTAPEAQPAQPPGCPRCGRPARPAADADAPLPKRVLRTRAGDIELARQRWRCTACRVVFFPPG
jgi:hypothetical protein